MKWYAYTNSYILVVIYSHFAQPYHNRIRTHRALAYIFDIHILLYMFVLLFLWYQEH